MNLMSGCVLDEAARADWSRSFHFAVFLFPFSSFFDISCWFPALKHLWVFVFVMMVCMGHQHNLEMEPAPPSANSITEELDFGDT